MKHWATSRFPILLAFAQLASCGSASSSSRSTTTSGETPTVPEFAAGSRLLVEYWQVDEQQVFADFWDSEREEACVFDATQELGQVHHCLPVGAPIVDAYADEACSSPLIDPVFAPGARYAVDRPVYGCAAPLKVFRLAAPAPVDRAFYRMNDRCLPVNIEPGHVYAGVESEVSIDEFAIATEQPELTDRRIGALTAISTDGAQQRIAGWDTERKQVTVAEGWLSGAWSPAHVAWDVRTPSLYSDAACSGAVVGIAPSCPADAAVMYSGEIDEVGVESTNGLYAQVDRQCQSWAAPSGAHYFEIGAAIPKSVFEPAHVVETGQGRIRGRYYAAHDDVPVLPASKRLRDTARSEDCTIYELSPGEGRCLPAATSMSFADSDCSRPVYVANPSDAVPTSCTGPETTSLGLPVVRAIGARSNGFIWQKVGDRCVFEGGDGLILYELGDEIPLTEFAAAELHEHEP